MTRVLNKLFYSLMKLICLHKKTKKKIVMQTIIKSNFPQKIDLIKEIELDVSINI